MNGQDNSLVGGLVSAATLVALNYGIGLPFESKRLEALIEGRPLLIIHNGHVFEDDATREADAPRTEPRCGTGCSCPEEVRRQCSGTMGRSAW
jgi:hypothetical protein